MSGSCPVSARVCQETARERDDLRRWKAEALPVLDGLQELGKALGLPLGSQIAGPEALAAVERLTREWDEARAEVKRLRALGDRLAATVSLLLYDAHPVYGSTATWHGGIGGQALTPVCCIIGGPPDSEWAQHDLPSDSLREWVAERGMDAESLDAAKDRERARLLAMLNPTKGEN